jgi:hypothetical protein|nr:MAG TPA: hypothetical protein [Caudoviricetes sp.]DAG73693.1 MAG TPA: hypothetical protein [Bacteriophage sp.]DAM93464.1 MAG TPA: hypothetical protein [Caudoviricetes sp.]DAO73881.1 MAG TPA: hypothetical protein [Caudoviricetes sp.]DAP76889.1 MAG TPA: hypothetical protein [Caudoviricetes sp.]
MAMKKIEELKDLFVGPKTLLYAKAITDLSKATIDITADLELPVEVDSLKATMEDPTINHYKVIGLAGDWATTSELGDFNVEFVVPSKAKDLLAAMFGNDAVSELTKVTLKTGDTELDATTGFTGVALELKKFKIQGTIAIVDDTKTNVMVITNIALYATLQWDETGTKPVAFKFSGSIEGAGKKSIAWLTKAAAA